MKKGESSDRADLKSLLDSMSESIWSVDRNFNFIFFNSIFAGEYHKKLNKRCKIGDSALKYLPPKERSFWEENYNEGFKGKKLEFKYKFDTDGGTRFFNICINPVSEDNAVAGLSVISTDITEKKLLQTKLRDVEEKFKVLTTNAPVGIFFDNKDGEAIYINDKCAEMIGVPVEKALNFDWVSLIHPDDKKRVLSAWAETIKNRSAFREVYRWVHPDGKIVWTEGFIIPIFDSKGGLTMFSGTLYDLTEEIAIQEKLKESEERFRTAFHTSPDSININSMKDGLYIDVNQGFTDITGFSRKETIGKTSAEINIWADLKDRKRLVKGLKENGIVNNMEAKFRMKDGKIVTGLMSAKVIMLNGEPHILSITRNIEDLKKIEKELITLNKVGHKLNSVLDKKECVRIILEEILEITNASASFLLIRKGEDLEAEEILFKDPLKKFKEFPVHKVAECLCGLAVKDKKSIFSKDIFKDTRCTWDECKGAGLRSAAAIPLIKEGEAFAVLGLGSFEEIDFEQNDKFLETLAGDFSIYLQNALLHEEIKKHAESLEEKVKKRTKELEDSNRELETFSYSVSHDLRAPLRAISGFSKILYEDFNNKLSGDGKELLEDIIENTKKMGKLIDDLLSLARIGRKKINKSEFDISSLFSVSFKELKVINPGKDMELIIGKMPRAKCDQTLIRQVALNLLSNAIKFSSGNKKTIIKISGKKIKNGWEYSVSDNGVGFDMRYKDKLFGVFQRLHSQDEFSGTGVGLAIVKKIVDIHGGNVWAESKVGVGSTFYFTLNNNDK